MNDADNFAWFLPQLTVIGARKLGQVFSECGSTGEIFLHKGFIDHRHARPTVTIALIKLTTLHDGNFHVGEILWPGSEGVDLQILARPRLVSLNLRGAPSASEESALDFV